MSNPGDQRDLFQIPDSRPVASDRAGTAAPIPMDPSDPQRRAADPTRSVWVSASAGTGKTKVLTDRVLRLLLDGAKPERLLCLTFTKAAAAEMTNRISEVLARWSIQPEADLETALQTLFGRPPKPAEVVAARRLFAQVLDTPGGLKIRTIHSFCQSLLARFPVEAGIPPDFGVLEDTESAALLAAARQSVTSQVALPGEALPHDANASDTVLSIRQAMERLSLLLQEDTFQKILSVMTDDRAKLQAALDHYGSLEALLQALGQSLDLAHEDTPDNLRAEACRDGSLDGDTLRSVAEILVGGGKTDITRGETLIAFLAAGEAERTARWDGYCKAYLSYMDSANEAPAAKLMSKALVEANPWALQTLQREAERIMAVRSRIRAATCLAATAALLTVTVGFLTAYEQRKRAMGRLDYGDLIALTRRLFRRSGAAEWVLYKLDGGLDHLLIDEAQDTSPDQWAVAWDLAEEFFRHGSAREDHRTLFVVGDRKQSIYSFQGADPEMFDRMRARIDASLRQWADSEAPSVHAGPIDPAQQLRLPLALIPLNVSFRSTQAVLDAVNAVFTRSEAAHGVLEDLDDRESFRHLSHRQGEGGLVELWPPVPVSPAEPVKPWSPPVEAIRTRSAEARLATLMADRIQAMVSGSEILESSGQPIQPGDIMVLLRRRKGFETTLVKELKARGIPVAGVDRMTLSDQQAVMDLLALAQSCVLPEDDLTLAATLKSPLIGLDEQALYTLAFGRTRQSLWQRLQAHAGAASALGRASDRLAELMVLARQVRPFDFFSHVLERMGGRQALLSRLGPEAEDPIDELLSQSLGRERLGIGDLRSFLQWSTQDESQIKRDLDQGNPTAVRIMTVHGSKGLQAPIVFLPETLSKPTVRDSLFWYAPSEEGPQDGEPIQIPIWVPTAVDRPEIAKQALEQVNQAQTEEYRRLLYVAMTRAADRLYICGSEARKRPAADCWYNMVHDALEPLADAVVDPFLAAHDVIQEAGGDGRVLRMTSAQTKPTEPVMTGLDRPPPVLEPPAWVRQAPPAEPSPPRPLAPSRILMEDAPTRSPLDGGAHRFRRGILIHSLLQHLPDLPSRQWAEAGAHLIARRLPDEPVEIRAALLGEVLAVLRHPEFAPVFGPESRAEVPLVGLVGDHPVSGQVDRLVIQSDRAMIIDFKTNRPPPRDPQLVDFAYVMQMAAYRELVGRLVGDRPISCILLWTDGPFAMTLPDRLMDSALDRLEIASPSLSD